MAFLWGGGLAVATALLLLAGMALFRWRAAYGAAVGMQGAFLLAVAWLTGVHPDSTATFIALVAAVVLVAVLALLLTPAARRAVTHRSGVARRS